MSSHCGLGREPDWCSTGDITTVTCLWCWLAAHWRPMKMFTWLSFSQGSPSMGQLDADSREVWNEAGKAWMCSARLGLPAFPHKKCQCGSHTACGMRNALSVGNSVAGELWGAWRSWACSSTLYKCLYKEIKLLYLPCEVLTELWHPIASLILLIMTSGWIFEGHAGQEHQPERVKIRSLALPLCACHWPRGYSAPKKAACVKARVIQHSLTISFALQHLKNDKENLHQHQGEVEAAKCQQCLCQAEEANSHPPTRQETEQERDAPSGHEIHQLPRQGPGRVRPAADSSGSSGQHPGILPASSTLAEHGRADTDWKLWCLLPWHEQQYSRVLVRGIISLADNEMHILGVSVIVPLSWQNLWLCIVIIYLYLLLLNFHFYLIG